MTYIDTLDQTKVDEAITTLTRQDDPAAEKLFAYCGHDYRFALWMTLVNMRIVRRLGLTAWDVEDWRWRDAFDDGSSPRDAVTDALEDLGYDLDEWAS
jgi:hypothetical protein